MAPSFVLASRPASTYLQTVRLGKPLAAALPEAILNILEKLKHGAYSPFWLNICRTT
jgi:hypothetical protein